MTRPQGQTQSFEQALLARGAHPVLAPTIAIEPVSPRDPRIVSAIADANEFAWIVFTSRNGVEAFVAALREAELDVRYLRSAQVAAIGPATSETLARNGLHVDLVPARYVAEELARELLTRSASGDRVLVFRAADARKVLPERLAEAGRRVTVTPAYRTVFAGDPDFAEKARSCDVVTFTSASSVRGFAHHAGGGHAACALARGKLVACIGPVTAATARQAGMHVDVVADAYTTVGLLDAIERRLKSAHP